MTTTNGSFSNVRTEVKLVHSNLDQEVIMITEDKLRLVLNEHLTKAEKKKDLIAPSGIFITIATIFATTTFKKFFFEPATWEAIFFICGAISLYLLIRAGLRAFNSPSVDSIIEKIKNKSENN
jgi:hypothetical protein